MRRFPAYLILLSALVLTESAVAVVPSRTALMAGFGISECHAGKVLFTEQPILKTNDYKYLAAAVLVRGESLASETYLNKRSDGWTHLSSHKSMIEPLAYVSNCLPRGEYEIRIEYYTRVPMVGDWLLGSGEYRVTLENATLPQDTQKVAMSYRKASLKDNLILSWPLFAFYGASVVLLGVTLAYIVRHMRKKPR